MNFFKSSLSKQNAILSYCPEAILIVGIDGEITFANKETENILGSKNILNRNFSEVFNVSFETISNSQISQNILKIRTENFEEKIIEVKSNKIDNEASYIVSINDVTKAHNIIQELLNEKNDQEKINHSKNMLLVKIANNITAPLHSVVGFSQAILEGLGGEINEKQEKYLSIIHKNSSELLFLFEQLLELSKIEANVYENIYKNFDITTTLSTIATDHKYLLEEKNLQLTIDAESLERKNCFGDETTIKSIISNLIKNAILSCDMGGITIKISTPERELLEEKNLLSSDNISEKSFTKIEIIDNGVGIPSNELEDLFDPYIQADKAVKKNLIKGLMLGNSKKLIQGLNGVLWVESEIMKGSKYSFIIPTEKISQSVNAQGNEPQIIPPQEKE